MLSDTIHAKGHNNISATHRTTLQITKDPHISQKADCIIAVSADKSISEVKSDVKAALTANTANVRLTIQSGSLSEEIIGRGSSTLTFTDTSDMVVRKSTFISSRTLLIHANKGARDLDRKLVEKLKRPDDIIITIDVDF